MSIKLKKKIAGILTGLMTLQIAFFGINSSVSLAYAETGLEKTDLSIGYVGPDSAPAGKYFSNSVTVMGDVLTDAKGDMVRFYAVINRTDDLAVNTPDVTIDPIPGAGAPAVVSTSSLERGHVMASERSLVLAWGPVGGFKMTDAYVDAYKVGVTNDFNTKVNKIGEYSISYTFFDLTDSKVIGSSTEDQMLTVTPTNIATTYKEATISVVSKKEFTNTVTLKGETLTDAFGSQARGYVVITRTDKTEEPVLSSDVNVTLNGVAGVALTPGVQMTEVSKGNDNSLVLGWNPFTLTNNFVSGVTSDFKVTFQKDGVYKFQNVIFYEDVEHLQGGFYANATPDDEGNVITVDTIAPEIKVTTNPKFVTDISKPLSIVFTGTELMQIKDVTFAVDGTPLLLDKGMFTIKDELVLALMKTGILNGDSLTEKGDYVVDVDFVVVDELGNTAKLKAQFNVDTEAPKAISGFVGNVDANGNVVLTWTNPLPNDYEKIEVYRDGILVKTLPGADKTFTDTTVLKGVAYKYDVVVYDAAGNYTHASQPLMITVPTPVTAVVATPAANEIASAAPATVTEAPKTDQDVKSESAENQNAEEKENNLPIWGIILLIILAGVGGYLFLSQKPGNEAVTVREEPIKPKAKSKK